jgi:hypothetical protein
VQQQTIHQLKWENKRKHNGRTQITVTAITGAFALSQNS